MSESGPAERDACHGPPDIKVTHGRLRSFSFLEFFITEFIRGTLVNEMT